MSKDNRLAVHVLGNMPLQQITPTFSKKTVQGEKQMVVWANLLKGGQAQRHAHKEEQTFWVTQGCMEVRVRGDVYVCRAGSVLTVPSNVEHEATALEDTNFVSFLSGVRQDLVGTTVPKHFEHQTEVR